MNGPVTLPGASSLTKPTTPESGALVVPALSREIRRPLRWGVGLAVMFFGVCGGWAATAPIAGAVIAAGTVSPESHRQTVQHLEGGIIQKILVREGDQVAPGDELLVVQDATAEAYNGALRARLITLVAGEARLRAERQNAPYLEFDHPVLTDLNDPNVLEAIQQEANRFQARRRSDETRKEILEQRIAQLEQQISGLQRQLQGVRTQIELFQEEIRTADEMVSKGLDRLPKLLALKRSLAGHTANEGEVLASIARAKEAIAENKLMIRNVEVERSDSVEMDLAATQASRAELEQEMRGTSDRLKRTVVRSPVAGIIFNLRFKTTGGVLKPGDAILDVVPTQDRLIIDARVMPSDIDDVQTGSHAYVMFPSYSQRTTMRIPGEVTQVSADVLNDEQSGLWYFAAKVAVDTETLERLAPTVQLTPGLPAQVFIATVDRTVLEFLVDPLRQVMDRSLREH